MIKTSGKTAFWVILVVIAVLVAILVTSKANEPAIDSDDTGAADVEDRNIAAYEVTVTNTSEDQPLSPGVFVVHTEPVSFDYEGQTSPFELESLAEYGDNTAFAAYAKGLTGIKSVHTIDEPIMPGESTIFTFSAQLGTKLSGVMMAVGSNDGYAFLDAAGLDGDRIQVSALNYDNGTEENSELDSGFAGGQPDPAQGEANIENGTATDPQAPVAIHDQLTESIMTVFVEPR